MSFNQMNKTYGIPKPTLSSALAYAKKKGYLKHEANIYDLVEYADKICQGVDFAIVVLIKRWAYLNESKEH